MIRYLWLVPLLFLTACPPADQATDNDFIPLATVRTQISINDVRYSALTVDKGWVYIDGGVRGLIIYREGPNTFKCFERACSYKPSNACARVSVDPSNFFMKDTCCKSFFDFTGMPTAGPAFRPLRQYTVVQDGILLEISN